MEDSPRSLFKNPRDYDGGFVYNVADGDAFTMPLSKGFGSARDD